MAANEIHVPDLGDFKDVLVIDVLVKPGDRIAVETPLVTLETDKATMDVPSPVAGVIGKVLISKGDKVSTGTLLATLEAGDAGAAEAKAGDAAPAAESKEAGEARAAGTEPKPPGEEKPPGEAQAAPAAQRAEETPAAESAAAAAAAGPPPEHAVPAAEQAATARAAQPTAPPVDARAAQPAAPSVDEAAFEKAHASPSVRSLARELGVDLGHVRGSGRKGRVTGDDVKSFVKAVMSGGAAVPGATLAAATGLPRVATVDFAKFGPVEVVPLTRIQRISGPRLHASWVNVPHVTQFEDADVTELEEARKWLKLRAESEGFSLTSLAFVLRACVLGLQKYPRFAASLDAGGQNLVMKKYCHVGFAADTPDGLVVPVIRDADRKDVFELARALADLSAKARTGKLSAAEMQGGCFTVSNLGGIGGTAFTPVINAPEVAVLGVSRAVHKPVYRDGGFAARLMLPLSLSYDHRVVDGADGARFTGFLAHALADVAGLMAALP